MSGIGRGVCQRKGRKKRGGKKGMRDRGVVYSFLDLVGSLTPT